MNWTACALSETRVIFPTEGLCRNKYLRCLAGWKYGQFIEFLILRMNEFVDKKISYPRNVC